MNARRTLALATLLALVLPVLSLAVPQSRKPPPPEKPLDLNSATVEELQQLPTVGPTAAKAIVRFREKSGPFRRVEDLLAVRGFTKKRLEKIRSYITVVPPSNQQGFKPQEGTNKKKN
ncbi:MAG: helix-hairpin-helix domain-containing protein [Acidobacteria bacterium]|nr:helix-hairpin-helix domain-containing protein [Acidobacteriota bacterium]MBI3662903.1 helix-hairpin-helix domain-containing protein [Acidobacteriota bacterium]